VDGAFGPHRVEVTSRIGLTKAVAHPLRYIIAGTNSFPDPEHKPLGQDMPSTTLSIKRVLPTERATATRGREDALNRIERVGFTISSSPSVLPALRKTCFPASISGPVRCSP